MRFSLMALSFIALHSTPVIADDRSQGTCTILNMADHPIVIGLYRPSEARIEERLVKVAPKTQLEGIPIPIVEDSQFVIAYKASLDEGKITRSDPILISGHRLLTYIDKSKTYALPDVIIQYRRSSSAEEMRRDLFNTSLYLPKIAADARRVLREANQTLQLVATPLAKQVYRNQSDP